MILVGRELRQRTGPMSGEHNRYGCCSHGNCVVNRVAIRFFRSPQRGDFSPAVLNWVPHALGGSLLVPLTSRAGQVYSNNENLQIFSLYFIRVLETFSLGPSASADFHSEHVETYRFRAPVSRTSGRVLLTPFCPSSKLD